MSKLSDTLARLISQPDTWSDLTHGLRLEHSHDQNGQHRLLLSRVRVYPSQVEVRTVMDALTGLGIRRIDQKTQPAETDRHAILLTWPDPRQLELGLFQ